METWQRGQTCGLALSKGEFGLKKKKKPTGYIWSEYTVSHSPPQRYCEIVIDDVLVDAVVDQQLGDECGEKRCGEAQTESTPRAIKCPPQTQRQSSQSETQLHVIHKVQLLRNSAELRTSEVQKNRMDLGKKKYITMEKVLKKHEGKKRNQSRGKNLTKKVKS